MSQEMTSAAKKETGHRGQASVDPGHKVNILAKAEPARSRSMEYGLAMLECFSSELPIRGVADLADMIGVTRSTTHRYCITLLRLGLLEQDDKHKYRLAARAASIGQRALAQITAYTDSLPILEELRDQTGHTASLAVMNGPRATYVQRVHGHRRGQYQADLNLQAGAHVPLHCTAVGKAMFASQTPERQSELIAEIRLSGKGPNTITSETVLLEQLSTIGDNGFAVCDEEHAAGVRAIALAVPDAAGRHALAIEITVPASHHMPTQLTRHFGPAMRAAARELSANMLAKSG